MLSREKIIYDHSSIQDYINKENNPFLKKSRTNNFKKLREFEFNLKEEYK